MPVKKGDKVKLRFKGKLKDGTVFGTTEGREPVEFKAGVGEMLPGIDEKLVGMEKGEEKEITLSPEKGFGERKEELVIETAKDMFKGEKLGIGQRVNVQTQQGQTRPAEVIKVEEDKVILDLNHPLAGKETTFEIKVVDIK